MLFEVRVLSNNGKVKKTISVEKLSQRHWKDFFDNSQYMAKNKSKKPSNNKSSLN